MYRGNWRRQWQPTPVLLPGNSHGRRHLVGCSPWGPEESDTTKWLHFHFSLSCIGEGHSNPLKFSCLENPMERGAWWAAIYGVAQSRTRLKWLSSSSSSIGEIIQYLSFYFSDLFHLAQCPQGPLKLWKHIVLIIWLLHWIGLFNGWKKPKDFLVSKNNGESYGTKSEILPQGRQEEGQRACWMVNERKNKRDPVCPLASLIYAGGKHYYYESIFSIASILFYSISFCL